MKNLIMIDETENLADNLEMALFFAKSDFHFKHKWEVIALYDTLYTALILGIQQFDNDPVIFGKDKDGIRMAYRNGEELETLKIIHGEDKVNKTLFSPRLIGISDAFEIYYERRFGDLPEGSDFQIQAVKLKSNVNRIIQNRDFFIHFPPSSLMYDTPSIEVRLNDVINLIEQILFDKVMLVSDLEVEGRIKSAITAFRDSFA